MSVFGPYYPQGLQQVVNHAERFAALMREHELQGQPLDEAGRTWVTGRAEEVELVVGFVVADWRDGRVSESAAVSAAASYLRAVHARAEAHLRIGLVPDCCVADVAPTEPATPFDQVTVAATPAATATPGDTLFDPGSMVSDDEGRDQG